jgi:hypothetical protein
MDKKERKEGSIYIYIDAWMDGWEGRIFSFLTESMW